MSVLVSIWDLIALAVIGFTILAGLGAYTVIRVRGALRRVFG